MGELAYEEEKLIVSRSRNVTHRVGSCLLWYTNCSTLSTTRNCRNTVNFTPWQQGWRG